MELVQLKKDYSDKFYSTSLIYLIQGNQILLGHKLRGFGEGKITGIGGKQNPDESIEKCAVRETREEIGVEITNFKKVGEISFYFPGNSKPEKRHQKTTVFLGTEYEGEILKSDEINPEWFDINSIPYNLMWQDNGFWLPAVLSGLYVTGSFVFDSNLLVTEFESKAQAL
jgi:8-oxo-dGTP diphosphatase